jgi:hypothetical protein
MQAPSMVLQGITERRHSTMTECVHILLYYSVSPNSICWVHESYYLMGIQAVNALACPGV